MVKQIQIVEFYVYISLTSEFKNIKANLNITIQITIHVRSIRFTSKSSRYRQFEDNEERK